MDTQAQQADPGSLLPWEVVVVSLKAFDCGDLEGSLAYWADDAVVRLIGVPPGERDTHHGKEEVYAWFQSLSAEHFEIQEELVRADGDTLTAKALSWSDRTRQLGVAPLEATEVYVVQNGKIASLTWTITPQSEAKLRAAVSRS